MTDIVERLRHEVEVFYGKPPCSLLNEAADEIERLREALRWIANNPFDGDNPAHLMRLTARAALREKENGS